MYYLRGSAYDTEVSPPEYWIAFYTSSDLVTWTAIYEGTPNSEDALSFIEGAVSTTLVAFGSQLVSGVRRPKVLKSLNSGGSWTTVTVPYNASNPNETSFYSAFYFNSRYVFVGENIVAWTTDLVTWNITEATTSADRVTYGSVKEGSSALIGRRYYADTAMLEGVKSTDGMTWTGFTIEETP